MRPKLAKAHYFNNPNIGLYSCCTDSFCLVPPDSPKQFKDQIKNILKVPVIKCTLAGTGLLGIFAAASGNRILLPEIVRKHELEFLESKGLECHIISSRLTALGNLLVISNQGIFASDELTSTVKKRIRQELNLKIRPGSIANLPYAGQLISVVGSHGLIAADATDEEISYAESVLGIPLSRCTVNQGSLQLRSGIIANANGLLMGTLSTPIEVQQMHEAIVDI